jgi:hypothetical protein
MLARKMTTHANARCENDLPLFMPAPPESIDPDRHSLHELKTENAVFLVIPGSEKNPQTVLSTARRIIAQSEDGSTRSPG